MGYHEIIVEDYDLREMLEWARVNFGEEPLVWIWSRRDWRDIGFYFHKEEDAALFKLFWA